MNTIYTTIRKLFDSALSEVVALNTDLLTRANTERSEMLALITRMRATQGDIRMLGNVCSEMAAELSDIYCEANDIANKIGDALDEPTTLCPETPYENLVGFCEECGKEVTYEDLGYCYDPEDDSVVCGDCASINDEDVDELAESVTGA